VGGRYVHIIPALPICSLLHGVSPILMIYRALSSRRGVLLQFVFPGNSSFSYVCDYPKCPQPEVGKPLAFQVLSESSESAEFQGSGGSPQNINYSWLPLAKDTQLAIKVCVCHSVDVLQVNYKAPRHGSPNRNMAPHLSNCNHNERLSPAARNALPSFPSPFQLDSTP